MLVKDNISKKDLKSLLLSHEKRETEGQEKDESKKEQELEAKAGIHEGDHKKAAFWKGFGESADENLKAHKGFDSFVHGFNTGVSPHHNLPSKVVSEWRSQISAKTHPKESHGYNHFGDSLNKWLQTPEGDKWNAAQAKKKPR